MNRGERLTRALSSALIHSRKVVGGLNGGLTRAECHSVASAVVEDLKRYGDPWRLHRAVFTKAADFPFWLRVIVIVALGFFVINLLFFLVPSARFIAWASPMLSGKEILSGAGTLVASFAGAWFAFRFARYQRERDKMDTDVAAGNRALFILTNMFNALRQHQKEVVDPYRNRHDAWLNLHVAPLPIRKDISFDLKELSFVMEADAQTFAELLLEEERFRLAFYLVEEHKTLVFSEVWPRLEAAGLKIRDNRTQHEIETALGAGTVQKLRVMTAAIIKNFDENVKSCLDVFQKLRATLKAIYPERKFIDHKPL
jgi:hypothetical protein